MVMRSRLVLFTSSALALVGFSSSSFAQAAPTTDTASSDSTTQAPGAEQEIQEIVVTARRREERLQDVPISITALSAATLESARIESVLDLPTLTPGLVAARNYASFLPNIRGVGSTGVSLTDESNIALYIDGIYHPDQLANIVDLVEVDRIEVLKGPQGTLFGRNATGGSLNIITPEPKFETRGRVVGEFSRVKSADFVNGKVYINTPLSSNIAMDFAGLIRRNDPYVKAGVGGARVRSSSLNHGRIQFLFRPSDFVKFILAGSINDSEDGSASALQPLNGNAFGGTIPGVVLPTKRYRSALSFPTFANVTNKNVSLRTDLDLGAVRLATSTAYARNHVLQDSDNDGTSAPIQRVRVDLQDKIFSQEVRLLSNKASGFDWIAGAYYFNMAATSDVSITTGAPPTYANQTTRLLNPSAKVVSGAGFFEGTLEPLSGLKLTAGARFTSEKRDWTQIVDGATLFGGPQSFTQSQWTYRGIAQYTVSRDLNFYGSISTGYKSGVYNTYSTVRTPTKPEKLTAFEIGSKGRLAEILQYSIAGYYYDYRNYQVVARQPGQATSALINADKARIYGLELELNGRVTSELSLRGALAYNDAKYSSFPNAIVYIPVAAPGRGSTAATLDVRGNSLISAPKFTASIGLNWSHDFAGGQLGISTNAYYKSKTYFEFANRVSQSGYATLGGEISWTTPSGLRLYAFGRNLTGVDAIEQARIDTQGDNVTYIRPRQIGAGVEFRF